MIHYRGLICALVFVYLEMLRISEVSFLPTLTTLLLDLNLLRQLFLQFLAIARRVVRSGFPHRLTDTSTEFPNFIAERHNNLPSCESLRGLMINHSSPLLSTPEQPSKKAFSWTRLRSRMLLWLTNKAIFGKGLITIGADHMTIPNSARTRPDSVVLTAPHPLWIFPDFRRLFPFPFWHFVLPFCPFGRLFSDPTSEPWILGLRTMTFDLSIFTPWNKWSMWNSIRPTVQTFLDVVPDVNQWNEWWFGISAIDKYSQATLLPLSRIRVFLSATILFTVIITAHGVPTSFLYSDFNELSYH